MSCNVSEFFCFRAFTLAERCRSRGFQFAAEKLYTQVLIRSAAKWYVDMLRAASRHLSSNISPERMLHHAERWASLKDRCPNRLGPMSHWAYLAASSGERDFAQREFQRAQLDRGRYSEEAFYWRIAYIDFLVAFQFVDMAQVEACKLREEIHLFPLVGIIPVEILLAEAESAGAQSNPHRQVSLLQYATIVHPFDGRGWASLAQVLVGFDLNWSKNAAVMAIKVGEESDEEALILSKALLRHFSLNSADVNALYRSYVSTAAGRNRDATLLSTAAEMFFLSGEYDAAYELSQEAVEKKGNDFFCLFTALKASVGMKKIKDAEEYLIRAIEANPREAVWNIHNWPTSFRILYRSSLFKNIEDYFDEKYEQDNDINLLPSYNNAWHYDKIKKRREVLLDNKLPSCVLVTLAKSGSVSIGSILMSGFELVDAAYSIGTRKIIPSWLDDYARGGCCHVTHLEATRNNIEKLKKSGVKVIVHLRDPRQVLISHVYHNLKYEKASPGLRVDGYDEMSMHEKVDYVLYTMWEDVIHWISKWVDAANGMDITFTTFEKFKADKDKFVDELISAYGGNRRFFNRNNVFVKDINVDNHFRSGQINEWRTLFTKDQIEFVNDRFPRAWSDLFGWNV